MRRIMSPLCFLTVLAALAAGCGGKSAHPASSSTVSETDKAFVKMMISTDQLGLSKAVLSGAPHGQDLQTFLENTSQALADRLSDNANWLSVEERRKQIDEAITTVGLVGCETCKEILRKARP
jgi:hypothetical protein